MLVSGEAGIGKTALVDQFCRNVAGDARVLKASCDALSTPGPFGPLRDIAPMLGGEVQQLLTRGAGRDELYYAVLASLGGLDGTAILIGEDAQWADQASLELLRFLGRRVSALRLLFIVTYRDDEVGPTHPLRLALGDLASAPFVYRIALPSLSEEAIAMLAAGSAHDPAELYRLTDGNPFFVTEILAAADASIPASVSDAVLARAARLAPDARAALDVAAVLGNTFAFDLLTRVAGPVDAAIDECCAHGVLRSSADTLAFRHELARAAILAAITPTRRRLLHGRVLATLREDPVARHDSARLAHHAEAAGDGAAALELATAAAAQAGALRAHREAAAQYARALRHAQGLPDAQRAQLLEGRSYACYLSDQGQAAIEARRAALAIWRRLGERLREGDNLRWLSRVCWFEGQNAAAEEAGQAALEVLEALPPGPELAMAYSNAAQLRMLASDLQGTLHWGRRAIALAEQCNELETLVHALTNVGTARMQAGDAQGHAELERALELATAAGLVDHACRARVNLAWMALERVELEEAQRWLDAALAYATEHDLDNYRLYLLATITITQRYHGAWDAALEAAQHLLRGPRLSPLTRVVALTTLGRIQTRRGQPAGAATLAEALRLAEQTGELQRLGPVRAALAEAAWLAGEPDQALAQARAAPTASAPTATAGCTGNWLPGWRWLANMTSSAATSRSRSRSRSRACRNLRIGHSVKGQKLVPLGVVGCRPDVAEHRSGCVGRSRADLPDRRCVARRGPPINRGRVIAEVRHDDFVVLCIDKNAVRITELRMGSL